MKYNWSTDAALVYYYLEVKYACNEKSKFFFLSVHNTHVRVIVDARFFRHNGIFLRSAKFDKVLYEWSDKHYFIYNTKGDKLVKTINLSSLSLI